MRAAAPWYFLNTPMNFPLQMRGLGMGGLKSSGADPSPSYPITQKTAA